MSLNRFEGNLFKFTTDLSEIAHCMLCNEKKDIEAIGLHKDGFLIGFMFACPNCAEIAKNADVHWEMVRDKIDERIAPWNLKSE